MSYNRYARGPSPDDSPYAWQDLSVENTGHPASYYVKKAGPLRPEMANNALSGKTIPPEGTPDQQSSSRWEETPRYRESSSRSPISSTSSTHTYNIRYDEGSSNSPQGFGNANGNYTNAPPYSSTPGNNTTPASHSSPEDMTEYSSTIEASAPESPDAGASDRDRNQNTLVGHPRPFSRKSKAGNQHTVTPAAAGPEGGFICNFLECGELCGKPFKLPSDIRFHLIEDHMNFSPFQCDNCMRVYTRKSLYTRHLKGVSQEGTTGQIRQCPHRATEQDEAFRIRKKTYEALWAIQVTQDQVNNAIDIINQHNNGALPSRRRRTQNINGPEPSEVTVLVSEGLQILQPADHLHGRDGDAKGFLSQQTSPSLGSQPSEADYPSALPRCSSAPDLFPQARILCNGYPTQDPMTDSAEGRRHSNLPNFESSHPFQPISTYQNQQDSSSLPGVQPPVFHRYLEVGTSPYNPPPRISAYHDPLRAFIETIPTVDPHVLHQVPNHRHSSWDDSGVGSNYDGTAWTAGARDQNYRHQMAYESGSQAGYREDFQYSTSPQSPQSEHIQNDPFAPAPKRRRPSFNNEHREEDPKTRQLPYNKEFFF